MKKIKIKICNYDQTDKFSYGQFLARILQKYYEVEFSDNPDYVFFHESTYDYLKYNCIRIFFTGENVFPNFNLCDYGIGFDYMTFGDRYYRMPIYLVAQFYSDAELALMDDLDFTKQKPFTKQDLVNKTAFCSFVYSNYLADPERGEIFNKLSAYKKVDAGGVYLNNTGGRVKNKLAFEQEHKFSVAFENSSSSGYTTEKLVNAFAAKTIPIYWGNPDIAKEFNQDRFINCHAYKNFDEVVKRVKEIDQNDELYLKIINQPIVAPGYDFQAVRDGFENFLRHIFDQPLSQAKRRKISVARAALLEAGEAVVAKHLKTKGFIKKQLARLYQPFKKIQSVERFKQKILANKIHKKG
jgi:hypothetical protein